MSLLKTIWSLVRRPRFSAPTNTEAAPPDGSMYFGDSAFLVIQDIPKTHIQYEFSANWEEDNHDVAILGFEMIQQLCDEYIVLTEISSNKQGTDKRPVNPAERFTVRYHSFLKNTHPEVSVYEESESKLFVLSNGFNKNAYFAYADINTSDWCSFNYYLFRKASAPVVAKQAREAVKSGHYDMWLFLTNGPITFEIVLNPSSVDTTSVQTIVEGVCNKNNILLFDPADVTGNNRQQK